MTVLRQCLTALRALLVLTVALGVLYPLAVTGVARAMPGPANGSIVHRDGREVGSRLLGQQGAGPEWFAPRPSAVDGDGATSGGSNLAQDADELHESVAERRLALRKANPQAPGPIPDDALTASGSGLDPDISVAYARWQAPRVAAARHLPRATVERIIDSKIARAPLGYLGPERVNVLELNLALSEHGSH